jgi:hypothetical protein
MLRFRGHVTRKVCGASGAVGHAQGQARRAEAASGGEGGDGAVERGLAGQLVAWRSGSRDCTAHRALEDALAGYAVPVLRSLVAGRASQLGPWARPGRG